MIECVLGALIVVLVVFVGYREIKHTEERVSVMDRHYAEREALLNRLMARNLSEYVQADMVSRYQPAQQATQQQMTEEYDIGI